jgi:hypothetical protein
MLLPLPLDRRVSHLETLVVTNESYQLYDATRQQYYEKNTHGGANGWQRN